MATDGWGVQSAWGSWINWLYWRYSPANPGRPHVDVGGQMVYATIHGLEISNEPNGQLWPQRTAPADTNPDHAAAWDLTTDNACCATGQMMQSAIAIGAAHANSVKIYGPGTADTVLSTSSRLTTKFDEFTDQTLNVLASLNSLGNFFSVWTQHNYRDLEQPLTNTRASVTQALLQARWNGYHEAGVRSVFMTEGGVMPAAVGGLAQQAAALASGFARLNNDTAGQGRGIGMYSQYLYNTATSFDCGLIDYTNTARPAYNTFKGFRSI